MGLRYEELRRRTEYSYLQAHGRLGDHVNRGRELGYRHLCVTDSSTLRYAYDLHQAAYIHTPEGEEQPHIIYGSILNVVPNHLQHGLTKDDEETVALGLEGRERQKAIREEEAKQKVTQSWGVTLRVMEGEGFKSLSWLTSIAWGDGCYRGIPRVDMDLIYRYNEGLTISFGGPDSLLGDYIIQGRMSDAVRLAQRVHAVFGDRFYLEIMPHGGLLHRKINKAFARIAQSLGIQLIAVNDVHYVRPEDTDAHTVLLCLAAKMTMDDPDHPRSPDGYHLRTGDEMLEAFQAEHPYLPEELVRDAIEATVTVAQRHTYKMVIDRFKALVPHVPHDSADDIAEVTRLCTLGWKWRDIPGRAKARGVDIQEYVDRLKRELDVDLRARGEAPIACAKFPGYFLIVRDLINWCRDVAKPPIMTGPGRGSAAGSLVCFLLGITSLDPLEHALLFERFISPSRIDMPDIDMDFEDVRREEVIQYLIGKYGEDKVSLIATVGRMKGKSALKDVGRVLGIPFGELNDVTGAIVERSSGDERASQTVEDSFKEFEVCRAFNAKYPHVLPLVVKLEGHARQPGVHAAGVVTSPVPLPDVVPVETHMRNNEVVNLAAYDMYGVGGMGLLKLDVLGLRTLTVLNDARKAAERRHGITIDFETLPLDDKDTLQAFTDHHYIGIFQYDSTGAHAACEGITFDSFDDIVAMVALNRPGPARSGLATEFKKRKLNPKRRDEAQVHPLYDSICADSLGVLVYQEQVTRIFTDMAGYDPGSADSLRKVIAKKIGDETLKRERAKFVAGAKERGVPEDVAEKIISDITFFGSYGFNKSHSAAYGIIGYWQMWMKVHYPAELMWALMKNEPQREQIARFAKEAERLGVKVRPPDVNFSGVGFALDKAGNIVTSLTDIKNVGETAVTAIASAQPFTDIVDFFTRVSGRSANSRVLESMIKAGAMRSLLPNTRLALETAKDKGWLDLGRSKKGGWEEALRETIASWAGQEDYPEEDLLYLAGEVSPLGGGRHPMAVYESLMSTVLKGCSFTPMADVWVSPMPLVAGVMIDIKYNQVGDFDTVEPDEATKKAMGWGQRYANINIEDETGTQVRVKVHQDNFPEFRWILDQGIGTCMAMRLLTYPGVKAARALYVVDLETMRSKARHGLAFDGYEKLLTDQHPARVHAEKGDLARAKSVHRSSGSFTACGLIVGHKHIITKRTGQDMGFITMELPDHSCLEITVFPDSYADWSHRLKVNSVVRIALRKDKRSIVVDEDGVLGYWPNAV